MIEGATLALVEEQVQILRDLSEALGIVNIEQLGLDVFVTILRKRDQKTYVVRFRCDGWPIQPASVLFVDAVAKDDIGPEVWPSDGEQAIKKGAIPRFICIPGTREYLTHHGPVQPTVHGVGLAVVLQQVIQCIEVRG